jgi:steroid delta-isomerase-like uncharacterized protein
MTHIQRHPVGRALLLGWIPITILAACTGSADSQRAANIETVTLNHTEVWSEGHVELIPTLYADGYVGHFPGGTTLNGREDIQAEVENVRSAFPDWTETVEQIVADGDWIVTVYRSTGTHSAEFLGNPATGNVVEILEASVFRMVDGKIAEQWAFPDVLSLQTQTASK